MWGHGTVEDRLQTTVERLQTTKNSASWAPRELSFASGAPYALCIAAVRVPVPRPEDLRRRDRLDAGALSHPGGVAGVSLSASEVGAVRASHLANANAPHKLWTRRAAAREIFNDRNGERGDRCRSCQMTSVPRVVSTTDDFGTRGICEPPQRTSVAVVHRPEGSLGRTLRTNACATHALRFARARSRGALVFLRLRWRSEQRRHLPGESGQLR